MSASLSKNERLDARHTFASHGTIRFTLSWPSLSRFLPLDERRGVRQTVEFSHVAD
jgi:hypothetical protein